MYKRNTKRIIDLFLSISGFLILLPLSFFIYIVLFFINDGKPLFFQPRPGKNEKIFNIMKFRTMTDKTDRGGKLLPDADRLTNFGNFLRKTSLDEIPQLLNIIKGQMSLIGPRPLRVRYLPYYTEKEQLRHTIRPGITGLAQIKGYRGEIIKPSDILNRIRLDIMYVEKWSFLLDFKIIILTILNAISGEEKAY